MAKGNFLVKFWLTIASVILAVVVICGVIIGYLFIAHKISVFSVNGYIEKLNTPLSAEDATDIICTEEYLDDVAYNTAIAFSGRDIFVYDYENSCYKLNSDLESGKYLIGDIRMSGVQIASVINFLAKEKEIVGQFCVDDREVNLSELNIKLVELGMQNSTTTTCDMKFVFELDFSALETKMSGLVQNWLKKKISAEKVYITCDMTFAKGDSLTDYSLIYNGISLNNFTSEDSEYFLSVFETFFRFVSEEELSKDLVTPYLNLIFGTEENSGFIKFLTNFGVTNYSFTSLSDQSVLVLN